MNKKIAALVVTYNPEISRLQINLENLKKQINNVLVVDNGSVNISDVSDVCDVINVDLIKAGVNKGIAAAQNIGFNNLRVHDIEWVLTLDQDSLLPNKTIDAFRNSGKMEDESTGIIAISYYDRNWSEKQKRKFQYNGKNSILEKDFTISSGNLVNIKAWGVVGGFDEFLFIDMVDYDFDAKLKLAGYKSWQLTNVFLNHEIGKVIHKPLLETILFLPDKGRLADHSAFRQYYIYRNSIIFYRRYPMFFKKRMLVLRTFLSTRRLFVYDHPIEKLKKAWKGIADGNRYNPVKDKQFQSKISNCLKYKETLLK